MGIIAIKTERTQIHFLSDVLIAVASLDVKVPINLSRQERLIPAKVSHATGYNMQHRIQANLFISNSLLFSAL